MMQKYETSSFVSKLGLIFQHPLALSVMNTSPFKESLARFLVLEKNCGRWWPQSESYFDTVAGTCAENIKKRLVLLGECSRNGPMQIPFSQYPEHVHCLLELIESETHKIEAEAYAISKDGTEQVPEIFSGHTLVISIEE